MQNDLIRAGDTEILLLGRPGRANLGFFSDERYQLLDKILVFDPNISMSAEAETGRNTPLGGLIYESRLILFSTWHSDMGEIPIISEFNIAGRKWEKSDYFSREDPFNQAAYSDFPIEKGPDFADFSCCLDRGTGNIRIVAANKGSSPSGWSYFFWTYNPVSRSSTAIQSVGEAWGAAILCGEKYSEVFYLEPTEKSANSTAAAVLLCRKKIIGARIGFREPITPSEGNGLDVLRRGNHYWFLISRRILFPEISISFLENQNFIDRLEIIHVGPKAELIRYLISFGQFKFQARPRLYLTDELLQIFYGVSPDGIPMHLDLNYKDLPRFRQR